MKCNLLSIYFSFLVPFSFLFLPFSVTSPTFPLSSSLSFPLYVLPLSLFFPFIFCLCGFCLFLFCNYLQHVQGLFMVLHSEVYLTVLKGSYEIVLRMVHIRWVLGMDSGPAHMQGNNLTHCIFALVTPFSSLSTSL